MNTQHLKYIKKIFRTIAEIALGIGGPVGASFYPLSSLAGRITTCSNVDLERYLGRNTQQPDLPQKPRGRAYPSRGDAAAKSRKTMTSIPIQSRLSITRGVED